MCNFYFVTVHSFCEHFYLFIAFLLFSYNNKGPLFYTYFMALNGLCVPMCLQASILSYVPVSADVNKLQNQVSAGNISATELTSQINHIVRSLDMQVSSSSFFYIC